MRDQFLVEVADSTAADLAEQGLTHAGALLELNALFTAWVESQYHHRTHSETGQTPLARWDDGWQIAGQGPVMPSTGRVDRGVPMVRATDRHQDRDGVAARQHPRGRGDAGRRQGRAGVCPFDLETIEVHYRGRHHGRAVPFHITRHTHPKARPETPDAAPVASTGIAYLALVADAHQQQLRDDERIGFHALYSTPAPADPPPDDAQLPGQLSINDALAPNSDDETAVRS